MHKYAKKIKTLMESRGWSVYKLADESGLYSQTIHKWFSQNSVPTLPAIEQICNAFQITIGEFFTEGSAFELTPERKELFDAWGNLSKAQREAVWVMIKSYLSN